MQEDAASDLVDALAELTFAVQATLGAVAREHDLSIVQMRLLGILRDREPGMLDLARVLGLEKSSVTGLVDRAEKRGLVQRFDAEHDGRGVNVRLTRDGRRLAATLEQAVARRVDDLAADLSGKDRAQLTLLARRVVDRVDGF